MIILASTEDCTGESSIGYSRIFTRVFLQLGLKFTSDTGELILVYFIKNGDFRPCNRGATMGNKRNNK